MIGYDAYRNQLVVSPMFSNLVVLHRPGSETTISMDGETPDPSAGGQPVTFTARLTVSPNAPIDGQVTFTASSGESCVDSTPTQTSPAEGVYSCSIVFASTGVATVVAEYTGSIVHAYSRSAPELHTTIGDLMFANGFEAAQ